MIDRRPGNCLGDCALLSTKANAGPSDPSSHGHDARDIDRTVGWKLPNDVHISRLPSLSAGQDHWFDVELSLSLSTACPRKGNHH